uniref:Uncharacterized protein n=1 Tax=Nelumbo nucifera TaxID=4432 RepID=A0A822ZPJ5_NELNU|nr:TPA_asm: hypothetical protein HUJ06_003499 [Nelumbo nucifera]
MSLTSLLGVSNVSSPLHSLTSKLFRFRMAASPLPPFCFVDEESLLWSPLLVLRSLRCSFHDEGWWSDALFLSP